MVTLPVYQSSVPADSGAGSFRTIGTQSPVGSAIAGLGAQIGDLAISKAKYDARIDAGLTAEAAKQGAVDDGIRYEKLKQGETELFRKMQEEAGPGAQDFTKNFAEARAKFVDDFIAGTPPERKADWELQLAKEETHSLNAAATFEHSKREGALKEVLTNQGQVLFEMTKGGGDPAAAKEIAAAKVRNLAGIVGDENSPRAQALKKNFEIQIEAGVIERARASNPVLLERELSKRIVGNIEARPTNDPSIEAGVDASRRYDLDPRMNLALKYTEGGFGPKSITARASKTIFGPWQISQAESTKVGMGDQHFSTDPAIQAEIAARVLKSNSMALSANGLDVNFVNMKGTHWLGLGGWIAANKADPNTPMRDLYARFTAPGQLDTVMATNGWNGKTVGQVINSVKAMEKAAYAEVDKVIGVRGKPSEEPLVVNGYKIEAITNDQLPAFYSKTQADVSKLMDATVKEAAKVQVDLGSVNSENAHDREAVHKAGYADELDKRILTGDEGAYAKAVIKARDLHMVSQSEAAAAQKLMGNKADIGMRAKGFELGLVVHDADPTNGLQYSKFDDDSRRQIEQYARLRSIEGITPEEAIRRVDRMNTPEFKAKTTELAQRIKDERSNRSFSELGGLKLIGGGKLDTGGLFSRSNAPNDPRMKDFLTEQYRDQFEYHMKANGGDSAEAVRNAKALAQWDMQRMMGVSNITGKPQVTIFPPENYYPAAVGTDGKPSKAYIQDQAVDFVKQKIISEKQRGLDLGGVTRENVFLRPTAETASDIRLGKRPSYEVIYITGKGQLESAGSFRASPDLVNPVQGTANGRADAGPRAPKTDGNGLASVRKSGGTDPSEPPLWLQQLNGTAKGTPTSPDSDQAAIAWMQY